MSAALKNKYIVRTRHSVLGRDKFVPVNPAEGKKDVEKEFIHNEPIFKEVENEAEISN